MFLAGQARPDHKTIGEFRRRHLVAFGALFIEVLALCQRAGLVKLGRVALDGTKIAANASKHKAMSYDRMVEREAQLAAEVAAILREAEEIDAAEDKLYGDARGDELPPEMRTREGRLRKIREAKEALEREAKERTGDPEAVPEPKAQRNFTDPESKIMRSRTEGFVQAYNAGAVVDEKAQVIVATTLSPIRPTAARCRPWSTPSRPTPAAAPGESSRTPATAPPTTSLPSGTAVSMATSPQAARATDPQARHRRPGAASPPI